MKPGPRQVIRIRPLCVLVLSLAFGTAALAQDTPGEYYEDARQRFDQGDDKSALIQLKNALQLDSQHVPSLVLSGEIYLEQDEPAAAEDAFSDAMLLGADKNYVALKLAEAYLKQGKYHSVTLDLPLDGVRDRDARVRLLASHAEAYIGLGQLEEAQKALDEALGLDPDALLPLLSRSTLEIRLGQLAAAERTSQQLLALAPEDTRAWNASASVLHAQGRLDAALESYAKAIALDARNANARVARIGLLIDLERLPETLEDLEYLEAEFPSDPRAAYLRGYVHAQRGEREEELAALKQCTEIIAVLPVDLVAADSQLSMSASLSFYGLGEFESARAYLERYLLRNPADLGAGRLQASVLLKLGATNNAIKLIQLLLQRYPGDLQLMNLMASAYSQAGEHVSAIELLEELSRIGYGGADTRERLARTRLDAGQSGRGINELAALFESDESQVGAGFSLSLAYLRVHQYENAIETAQRILKQDPANLSVQNLLGLAFYFADDFEAAAKVFEGMIKQAPELVNARVNLARVELAAGQLVRARVSLDRLLEDDPDNGFVLLEQARLARLEGNLEDARLLAENAVRALPGKLEPRRYLLEIYLQIEALTEAEELARETVSLTDDNLEAMAILGQVLTRLDKTGDARVVYGRMAMLAGFDPVSLYKIARLQMEVGALRDAQHNLNKALGSDPDFTEARLAYIQVHLLRGQNDAGLRLAREAARQDPENADWFALQGQALLNARDLEDAREAFKKALALRYQTSYVLGLYQSLVFLDRRADAETMLKQTLEKHPNESLVKLALVELVLQDHRWKEGKQLIAELLERFPAHSQLLNNMANVKLKLDESGALEYARRAHAVAPDDPRVNDTLGWLLVQNDKAAEGLAYLREATTRNASNPELRYHLAVALHRLGREQEARKELESALASAEGAEWLEDALALMVLISSSS